MGVVCAVGVGCVGGDGGSEGAVTLRRREFGTSKRTGKPEICDPDVPRAGDKEVVGLDVAVD